MNKGHPVYKIASRQSRTLSLKKQETVVRKMAHHYGVGVYFYKRIPDRPGVGFARIKYTESGPTYTIYILNDKKNDFLQTFFHELGHIYCLRTGRWFAYHDRTDYTTAEERSKALRAFISTGLRAEQWIDRWAANELKKWFPRYPYDFPYHQKDAKQWLEDNYLVDFRKELEKLKNFNK